MKAIWPEVKLISICRPTQWATIPQSSMTTDGYPVYGANGVIGCYTEFNHEFETLLITCRGATCGTLNVCAPQSYVTGNAMALDSLSDSVDLRFLFYALKRRGLKDAITGTAQPQITRQSLESVTVPLPPLPEQRRIAAILDKADAIRRRREEGTRLTEELLRSTFLEIFGDPATNPKGWETHPLQELVSKERPITYGILKPGPDTEGGIPYVRVVDIKNQRISVDSVRRTTKAIAHEYRRSTLQPGDILLSIRGHVGRCAVVPQDLAGANITQDTARICPRHEWSRFYLFWSLHIDSTQNWMAKHVRGVAVKGINLGDVKRMPLPLPPKDLCLKFDEIQSIANKQHDNRVKAYEAAATLSGSLVQRAFRGDL